MKPSLTRATMEITRNEIDQDVSVEGYVHYHVETNYGADADNNRGYKKTIIDDVTDVMAYNIDEEEVKLTSKEIDRAMEIIGNEFLES